MVSSLHGLRVAVLGGDEREVEVAKVLAGWGARVSAVGLPGLEAVPGVRVVSTLREAVAEAAAVIMPVQGTDEQGYLHVLPGQPRLRVTSDLLVGLLPGTLLFIGKARPFLKEIAAAGDLRLREFRDRDDFAIYNSIPTAEGAIQYAMIHLPVTIFRCCAFVLGFGRTGRSLARRLQGLGAITVVAARDQADLARIYEEGYAPLPFSRLEEEIGAAEVVFNTVPTLVLNRGVLARMKPGALILDLASAPGGTDFAAAEEMGLKAFLLPGLPGRVAPRTAGRIVADLLTRLIAEELPLPC